jgi:hypothetical protein
VPCANRDPRILGSSGLLRWQRRIEKTRDVQIAPRHFNAEGILRAQSDKGFRNRKRIQLRPNPQEAGEDGLGEGFVVAHRNNLKSRPLVEGGDLPLLDALDI